jgi:rubrerythrin
MSTKSTDLGTNRTGVSMSPIDSRALIEVTRNTPPSSNGGPASLLSLRANYIDDADPVGSMPPPVTLKGVVGTAGKVLRGQKLSVLLDKLGERLAFERTGFRLYDAVLQKFKELGSDRIGPSVAELKEIRDEEMRHFDLVRRSMESLGADPTAQTPCADITAVANMGLVQVVTDPRTNKAQCLSALLNAELIDNAGWELLIDLASELGHDKLVRAFRPAHALEEEHLTLVKNWLTAHVRSEGGVRRIPARAAKSRARPAPRNLKKAPARRRSNGRSNGRARATG